MNGCLRSFNVVRMMSGIYSFVQLLSCTSRFLHTVAVERIFMMYVALGKS